MTDSRDGHRMAMTQRALLGDARVSRLGLGTYGMGKHASEQAREVAALRLGLDLGMTLIDTAELYALGGAERVVGEAIRGRRDEVFLVTKVLPQNASRQGTIAAAERSLRRLDTDRIDLYLLHWQELSPLEETLDAFDQLVREQKIVRYGVSNFDANDMRAAHALPLGQGIAVDQVAYGLHRREIEAELLPWCSERGVVVMAYSPLAEGRLPRLEALVAVARRHGVTSECAALAWTLRHPQVVSIPKAVNPEHLRANALALALELTPEDLTELDAAYPSQEPTRSS